MKLFYMKNWDLHVQEEAWGLSSFKKLLDRDKTKDKTVCMKEMMFIYFFCDIKSDFLILPETERIVALKSEINLPDKWVIDAAVQEAIDLYKKYSQTTIQRLYQQALKSAQDVGNYLENTDVLLAERNERGQPVTDIAKVTTSLQRIPKLMSDLKASYKEVVKEQEDMEGKKKGSRTMGMFEDMNF